MLKYLGSIVNRKVIDHKGSLVLLSFGLIIKWSVIRVNYCLSFVKIYVNKQLCNLFRQFVVGNFFLIFPRLKVSVLTYLSHLNSFIKIQTWQEYSSNQPLCGAAYYKLTVYPISKRTHLRKNYLRKAVIKCDFTTC